MGKSFKHKLLEKDFYKNEELYFKRRYREERTRINRKHKDCPFISNGTLKRIRTWEIYWS